MKKKPKKKKECVYCKILEQEKDENEFTMVGIDRPYINLWFHRSCFKELSVEEMSKFLQENMELWYNE